MTYLQVRVNKRNPRTHLWSEGSWLQADTEAFDPIVGRLEPGDSVTIQIEVTAELPPMQPDPDEGF